MRAYPAETWAQARLDYESSVAFSFKRLSKKYGISEQGIQKRAKADGWQKGKHITSGGRDARDMMKAEIMKRKLVHESVDAIQELIRAKKAATIADKKTLVKEISALHKKDGFADNEDYNKAIADCLSLIEASECGSIPDYSALDKGVTQLNKIMDTYAAEKHRVQINITQISMSLVGILKKYVPRDKLKACGEEIQEVFAEVEDA